LVLKGHSDLAVQLHQRDLLAQVHHVNLGVRFDLVLLVLPENRVFLLVPEDQQDLDSQKDLLVLLLQLVQVNQILRVVPDFQVYQAIL